MDKTHTIGFDVSFKGDFGTAKQTAAFKAEFARRLQSEMQRTAERWISTAKAPADAPTIGRQAASWIENNWGS